MICYSVKGHPKPVVLIGAPFVGVERRLVISFYIVWLRLGYSTGYSHRLGWCGFTHTIFVIWWLFLSSVLVTLPEAKLFGRLFVSLCCGLCEERGMLRFLRILGRCLRWCETCFIYMFLFGSIVLTFLNNFLWVWFSLSFECNST